MSNGPPGPTRADAPPAVDVHSGGPPNPGAHKRIAGVALGAVGVALLGSGLYFGLKASQHASDTASFMGEWGPDQQSAEQAAQRDGEVGLVLTGLGVTGVLAGGILYWLGAADGAHRSSVSLAPAAGGGSVVWTCRL